MPLEHFRFLRSLSLFYETGTHFFIHANYAPNRPLDKQEAATALWKHLDGIPSPHVSGRIAVVGHTLQKSGRILNLPT